MAPKEDGEAWLGQLRKGRGPLAWAEIVPCSVTKCGWTTDRCRHRREVHRYRDGGCGLACVVLRDEHHKDVEVSFVVQFELNMDEKDADERDTAVNRRLLEGVDARSLLLNVLSGLPGGTSRSSSTDRQNGGGHANEPLLRRASIERILEVCTADPSRVYEVEAVLAACGDAENMSSFREFWAVQGVTRRGRRSCLT